MSGRETVILDAGSMAAGLIRSLERSGAGRSADPLDRAAGLGVAVRAMHLLALERLHAVRDRLPETNQALMPTPDAAIAAERDALAHAADFLAPIDVVDLLSEAGIPCVAPHLHRGWQDRKRSCQHAREVATGAMGFAIEAEERGRLMSALAIVNRMTILPPPVRLEAETIRDAYTPVLDLIERLAGPSHPELTGAAARVLGA